MKARELASRGWLSVFTGVDECVKQRNFSPSNVYTKLFERIQRVYQKLQRSLRKSYGYSITSRREGKPIIQSNHCRNRTRRRPTGSVPRASNQNLAHIQRLVQLFFETLLHGIRDRLFDSLCALSEVHVQLSEC